MHHKKDNELHPQYITKKRVLQSGVKDCRKIGYFFCSNFFKSFSSFLIIFLTLYYLVKKSFQNASTKSFKELIWGIV